MKMSDIAEIYMIVIWVMLGIWLVLTVAYICLGVYQRKLMKKYLDQLNKLLDRLNELE